MTTDSRYRHRQYYDELIFNGFVESGQHSEFRDGLHGYKADYESVAPPDSELFDEGVDILANFVQDRFNYPIQPNLIIGVANGANALALAVAKKIGSGCLGLQTAKTFSDPSRLEIPFFSERLIQEIDPEFALVLDDVGTTGSSTAQVALLCQQLGIPRVEALYLLQRSKSLDRLAEIGVAHQAVIERPMDNYTPEQCLVDGPCSEDIPLIRHPSRIALQ